MFNFFYKNKRSRIFSKYTCQISAVVICSFMLGIFWQFYRRKNLITADDLNIAYCGAIVTSLGGNVSFSQDCFAIHFVDAASTPQGEWLHAGTLFSLRQENFGFFVLNVMIWKSTFIFFYFECLDLNLHICRMAITGSVVG